MPQYPFSDLIRSTRRELRLSQKDVAERSKGKIGQPTLSAWETARLLPRTEDERLGALARVLDLELSTIEAALRNQLATDADLVLHTEDSYLAEQSEFVDENGGCVDIWLLGPEALPVLRSGRFRDEWQRNAQRGTTYHVVWFLCILRPVLLTQLAYVFGDIGASLPRDNWSIEHYGVVLFPGGGQADENCEEYETLVNLAHNGKLPGNTFHTCVEIPKKGPLFHLLTRTGAFSPFSAITVCKAREVIREPLASIHLPSARHSRSAASGPVWHLFDSASSFELANCIDKFDRYVRDEEAKQQKETTPAQQGTGDTE